ncbi:hypothetical protein SELMODRAFT_82101 [Selaginella moellendorffii]|uniref:Pentacotripeptide-repeat region of PRORP domain-containing protein n=1 Tax=Selaginella moellendorffii TaxID=88036 RepID=D8QZ47_SELML|nr:hypothetical protein SELMODRAFT_82101 [Selaginella moellendorffii]
MLLSSSPQLQNPELGRQLEHRHRQQLPPAPAAPPLPLPTRPASAAEYGRLLQACTAARDGATGKKIHRLILHARLEQHIHLRINLLHMYLKCGCLGEAREIFDKLSRRVTSVTMWTAMIAAYTRHHRPAAALALFRAMLLAGVRPNSITFVDVLSMCSSAGAEFLAHGRWIHGLIRELGFQESNVIVATALLKMYSRCGSLDEARAVFSAIAARDKVAWTAMMAVLAQHARAEDALRLCRAMLLDGQALDEITAITVLSACADESALPYGAAIAAAVIQAGLDADVRVANALVHMYGTCGSPAAAAATFAAMAAPNVISWTAIISAWARAGDVERSFDLFRAMQQHGVEPDSVSFVSLLAACSHAGLTAQALDYFAAMTQDHGIAATPECHGCLLDLLGRAGWLDAAEEMIATLPVEHLQSDARLWRAYLGACKTFGDRGRGQRAAGRLLDLRPGDPAGYVELASLYRKKS